MAKEAGWQSDPADVITTEVDGKLNRRLEKLLKASIKECQSSER
jgi:hypothetical protein